jgi:hypothetical protein
MTATSGDVVKALLDALARGEWEAVGSALHEDVELTPAVVRR